MSWKERILTADEAGGLSNLAAKYGVSSQEIARMNNIPWETEAINAWIMGIGGKMLSSGWAVFQAGNRVLLPENPVPGYKKPTAGSTTQTPGAPSPKNLPSRRTAADKAASKWILASAVGGAVLLLLVLRKKKSRK